MICNPGGAADDARDQRRALERTVHDRGRLARGRADRSAPRPLEERRRENDAEAGRGERPARPSGAAS